MSQMKEVYKSQLEMASIRLVKDAPLMSKTPIESPDKAVALLADYLSQMDREVICVINLRSDGCPINCSVCSIGAVNQAVAHPREIMKTAIENRQNLIIEGCYVPFDWRKDFTEEYLSSIRFLCLAMAEGYIDVHFDEIKAHGSDIESRLDDSDCTAEHLKEENRKYAEGFQAAEEKVIWIEGDYLKTISALLD